MKSIDIVVPDLGDFENVEVIEVLVNPGDRVEVEDSLVTLESDKATMEIPSSHAGVVRELCVEVGSVVSQGDAILRIEAAQPAEVVLLSAPDSPRLAARLKKVAAVAARDHAPSLHSSR